jgi:hypothetical protein
MAFRRLTLRRAPPLFKAALARFEFAHFVRNRSSLTPTKPKEARHKYLASFGGHHLKKL